MYYLIVICNTFSHQKKYNNIKILYKIEELFLIFMKRKLHFSRSLKLTGVEDKP